MTSSAPSPSPSPTAPAAHDRAQRTPVTERGGPAAVHLAAHRRLAGVVAQPRIGKLVHYADAISQGQPASLPRLYSPELDRLGHSLETMRRQLDGKAYIPRPMSQP